MSVCPELPADLMQSAVDNRLGPVPVFSTRQGRVVGHCQSFAIEGDDVWADVELDAGTVLDRFVHGEGVRALSPQGVRRLVAVILTSLPRGVVGRALRERP